METEEGNDDDDDDEDEKKRNCALFHLLWDTLKKRAVYSLFFLLLF